MLAGLSLPRLSEFDPPVVGEGSLDPMGLAAISDRLADRLVPGVRARMQKVRFVTTMAVGSLVVESLWNEVPADDVSTPAICFEWLVLEAFTRRFRGHEVPAGLPGSVKTRAVIERGERLSADTYLKGPRVFGFHGVYKPFAVDSKVVTDDLEPDTQAADLARCWEREAGLVGFTDNTRGTQGARFRARLTSETRNALREGRCVTRVGSHLFGEIAKTLHPDEAGPSERAMLRQVLSTGEHALRNELANYLPSTKDVVPDNVLIGTIQSKCSRELKAVIDAVETYEQLSKVLERAFRHICACSHSMGSQPINRSLFHKDEVLIECAKRVPAAFQKALDAMIRIDAVYDIEQRMAEFAVPLRADEFGELLLAHHEKIQRQKAPGGKRSWFDPFRDGWVVRGAYGSAPVPDLDGPYIHPIRVSTLHQFMVQSAG